MTHREVPGTASAEARRRYLARLRRAEAGPRVAALFDFDGTIIAGYSVFAFLQEKFRRREMSREELVGTADAIARYGLGRLDFAGLMATGAKFARGVPEERYLDLGEALFEKHLARRIYPETRDIIRAHQDLGHTVVIVSSATIYQVGPAAHELGIARVLCTKYEVEGGVFTGEVVRPLCFGPGKATAAEALAEELGLDLAKSYFYTDSPDDLPLLERVGKPRLLNPGGRLGEIAAERHWPVQHFDSRRRPGVIDYLRGMSPMPTLAGAIAASLPILALTRSARETANFVIGTFGDYASAIVGVDLDVRGEKNLWLARPCLFLFNHQSQADVFIIAKLVRRDMTGIGKKELRKVPLLGRLMEMGGMVFVDRAKTRDAIEAMAPLVNAIKREGKSVCIAPEGTRTLTPRLGPFKKGAFHLAIQAGVPIVPIVIHNSADVQPKHEVVMRSATVRVDVLPPVDTSRWRAATIDRHVREVRTMFLDCLGQSDKPVPAPRGEAAKRTRKALRTDRARRGKSVRRAR
jgi:putative phosphoserine phosphatase/1-acylglycerol-3-phosphate O-acyltransferase